MPPQLYKEFGCLSGNARQFDPEGLGEVENLREYRYYREYLGFKRKKDAVWSGIAECFKSVCDTRIIQMQDYLS